MLTSDELMTSGGPTSDDVDHECYMQFMESFNSTTASSPKVTFDELKHVRERKMKNVTEKTPPCSINIAKVEISQRRGIIHKGYQILDRVHELWHTRCRAV